MLSLLLLCVSAFAHPVRTLDGQRVDLSVHTTVAWSLSDPVGIAALRALSGCPGVLVVNTDPVQAHSQLGPTLRAHGINLPVVTDPRAELATDLRAADLHSDPDEALAALLPCLCEPLAGSGQLNACQPQADLGR